MGTGGEVANALVCKTSIRGFNSRPVLQRLPLPQAYCVWELCQRMSVAARSDVPLYYGADYMKALRAEKRRPSSPLACASATELRAWCPGQHGGSGPGIWGRCVKSQNRARL